MEYPIGVPIRVPLHCSIWQSFCNILVSYFIYSVVKVMEPGWSFVQKLDREREPRFHATDTWSSTQKNLILELRFVCQNFKRHIVAVIKVEPFRIVTHCFRENSFYVKLRTFFTAENIKFDTKITRNSESSSTMNMRSPWTVF